MYFGVLSGRSSGTNMIFCMECGIDIEDGLFTSCVCGELMNWSMLDFDAPEFSLVLPRNQYFLNFDSKQIFYLDSDRNIVVNQ